MVISGPDLSKDMALKSMNIDGVKKFLEEKLGLDIGVEEVWRVGKEESTKLVARLAGWDDKMKVVKIRGSWGGNARFSSTMIIPERKGVYRRSLEMRCGGEEERT